MSACGHEGDDWRISPATILGPNLFSKAMSDVRPPPHTPVIPYSIATGHTSITKSFPSSPLPFRSDATSPATTSSSPPGPPPLPGPEQGECDVVQADCIQKAMEADHLFFLSGRGAEVTHNGGSSSPAVLSDENKRMGLIGFAWRNALQGGGVQEGRISQGKFRR